MRAVLDASAIIALLDGELGGPAVVAVLTPGGAVSAVNLGEARDRLLRTGGDPSSVSDGIDEMVGRGLEVVPCDRHVARVAADLRAGHYHRVRFPVSLADCIGVVTAGQVGGALVTSDQHQSTLAILAGVDVHPIANSAGVVPSV